MSLKCLKKVRISETEDNSVVPRNDEGEDVSSSKTSTYFISKLSFFGS